MNFFSRKSRCRSIGSSPAACTYFFIPLLLLSTGLTEEQTAAEGDQSLAAKVAAMDLSDPDALRNLLDEAGRKAASQDREVEEVPDVADSTELPETFRYALKLSRLVNREDLAARYRQQLTERLVSMGRMAEAEQFSEEIPGYRRAITHARLSKSHARLGRLDAAENFLQKSDHNWFLWRPHARELIKAEQAIALAALGRFEEADDIAEILTRKVPQAIARSGIAVEKDRQGEDYTVEVDVEEVLPGKAYPERLKAAQGKMEIALEELAQAREEGTDLARAQEDIQAAVDLAFRANMDISAFLVDTADALREADEDEAANRLVNFVGWRINRLGASAEWRNEIMARLTSHYPEEKREAVGKSLEKALEGLALYQPGDKAKAIAVIGKGWAQIGETDKAREMWLKALEEVRQSQVPRNWAMVGIDICLHLHDCGLELEDDLKGPIEALLVDVPAAIRGETEPAGAEQTAAPEAETGAE